MAKIVVEHHVDDCIACGVCTRECPDFWELKDGASATHLKGSKKDDSNVEKLEIDESKLGCNQEAADSCPTKCIKIVKS